MLGLPPYPVLPGAGDRSQGFEPARQARYRTELHPHRPDNNCLVQKEEKLLLKYDSFSKALSGSSVHTPPGSGETRGPEEAASLSKLGVWLSGKALP